MTKAVRVLHVLPHPRGGGETYVDLLSEMDGFQSEKVFLVSGADERRDLGQQGRARMLDRVTVRQMLETTRDVDEQVLHH